MLFPNPVHTAIIESLLATPGQRTQELHETLGRPVSLSNFYKILATLSEKYIITAVQKKRSVHGNRIRHINRINNQVKPTRSFLKSGSFTAGSLGALDAIRADAFTTLISYYAYLQPMYVYNSHAPFILGIQEQESDTFSMFTKDRALLYYLIGNTSPLDEVSVDMLTSLGNKHIYTTESRNFLREGYYINAIGSHMIEVLLPKPLLALEQHIFSTFTSLEQPGCKEALQELFTAPCKCSLTIHYNKALVDATIFKIRNEIGTAR